MIHMDKLNNTLTTIAKELKLIRIELQKDSAMMYDEPIETRAHKQPTVAEQLTQMFDTDART